MVQDIHFARYLAEQLLSIKAVVLNPQNPFTWSSGIKSPIYCDNRLLLSFPTIRESVKSVLVDISSNTGNQIDAIAGVATAGIPHATLVADELNLPLAYIRSSPKKHGTENKVEGKLEKGQNVIVIEDLISTGGSCMSAVETIQEMGCNVIKVAAIFSYEFDKAHSSFEQSNIPLETVTQYSILAQVAKEKGYIPADDFAKLEEWRANPETWGT